MTKLIIGLYALALFAYAAWSAAADYPNRPIRLIVPFPPGGGTDIVGRTVGQHLASVFNQPVVVDNRPGGNTVIGTELAARAVPDGHTLLVQINNITALPALHPDKLPVSLSDLAPITLVGVLPHMLVVPRSSPASSVKELIALAKTKKLNYASAGVGTPVHLGGALFASMAGVNLLHVPYKGAADYTTAVLGGHVDMTFGSVPTVVPHVKSGVLKALAATTAKRVPTMPNVPTIAEAGLTGYDIASWYGLFAPTKTPRAIIDRLHGEVVRAIATKTVADRLSEYELIANTPAEFAAFLKKDSEITVKLIAQSGAKAD